MDPREKAEQILNGFLENPKEGKSSYSFYEIWEKRNEDAPLLIPDLLPLIGLVMLLGEDGIGKTQLVKQLIIAIAIKLNTFLGQPLNIRHGRGLFIATEDSKEDFIKSYRKQIDGLNIYSQINKDFPIDFIEGTNYDSYKDLLTDLESILSKNQYDLIAIDAFSDLFSLVNGEQNSNTHARQLLNPLQAIANKYQTLIVIIHHASKSAMKAKRERGQVFVEKNDCQGASAITQKPRTVLALSHDPKEGVNYLHCAKANGLPKRFKETAIKMQFDENTLLHEAIDFTPVFETEGNGSSKEGLRPNQIDLKSHYLILDEVYKGKALLGYSELINTFKLVYSNQFRAIGRNKAIEFITYYKLNKLILQEDKVNGKYYRSIPV